MPQVGPRRNAHPHLNLFVTEVLITLPCCLIGCLQCRGAGVGCQCTHPEASCEQQSGLSQRHSRGRQDVVVVPTRAGVD